MERVYFWVVPTAVLSVLALILSLNAMARTDGGPRAAPSGPQVLEVGLVDFDIVPARLEAEAGKPVTLLVGNDGVSPHDLVVDGRDRTPMLTAGEDHRLELGSLPAGAYDLWCDVAGHAELGMRATLVVGEGGDHEVPDAEEIDRLHLEAVAAFPAETRGKGGQPLEPEILDGVKVFELTATEIDWEVAPGDVRKALAYNEQVPGPEMRVQLGDRVRIVLTNRMSESTAIHWHHLEIGNDQDGVPGLTQDPVRPGASFTYEFVVPNSGTHMYHSHHNAAHQVPMGLFGAFIVEGPNEPLVDLDYTVVLNDGPHGFTINGKGFPATEPIVAGAGQTIRLRYMNEGLQGHPMHLHGMKQRVYAKDGNVLPAPYDADTVWVGPGERFDVLVEARSGMWAFHCHILTHAESPHGMFGMVTAMIVE